MALIVENGTGLADAESYASVSFCNDYHGRMGNTDWTSATDAAKEQALRKATVYLDSKYGPDWQGRRIGSVQALDWPRTGVYSDGYPVASNAVPKAIQRACAELAVRALSATLQPDLEGSGRIASESVSVGPISESKSYAGGKSQTPAFTLIDDLVARLLEDGTGDTELRLG